MSYLRIEPKKKNGDIGAVLLAVIFFVPNINYYISYILAYQGFNGLTAFSYALIYLAVVCAYIRCLKKSILPGVLLLLVVLLYMSTILIWPQNQPYMFGHWLDLVYNPFYRITCLGLPLLFLPITIDDKETLYRVFLRFSYVNIVVALVAFFWQIILYQEDFEYMTFAYYMIFAAFLCFVDAMKSKKKLTIVLTAVALVCIVLTGSRGAMICVFLFLVAYFFFVREEKLQAKQIAATVVAGLLLLIVIVNIDSVLQALNDFLNNIGYSSRTLTSVIEDSIFESTGRSRIGDAVWEAIAKSPIFGNGLFSDRLASGIETYAHNIFLELLCQFGVLLGGLLILFYCYNSIRFLFFKPKQKTYFLYFCILMATFFKLCVTSSYLTDPSFYLLIGMMLCLRSFALKTDREVKGGPQKSRT